MSTKFTMNLLANVPRARLRIYSGGHQVHVDLEPFDVVELAQEATKAARDLGAEPFPQVAPPKAKRSRRKKADDWKD